jgi:superfamily I DNA/RNA helicase
MPELRTLTDPDDEAAGIAASVRELEESGVALRDQAILCRTNDRLNDIAEALEDRGIPVLHLGSLFEREEIRDLLSILSLGADRFGAGIVRIAAMPRYGIPARDVKRLTDHLQAGQGYAIARLGELASVSGLTPAGAAGIARLAHDLQWIKPSASPWGLLSTYAGAVGNVREEAERSHRQEQECLFFVAMSRAKTHLRFYAYQR